MSSWSLQRQQTSTFKQHDPDSFWHMEWDRIGFHQQRQHSQENMGATIAWHRPIAAVQVVPLDGTQDQMILRCAHRALDNNCHQATPQIVTAGSIATDTAASPIGNISSSSSSTDSAILPSIGSVGHDSGSCKRCAFFAKGRCRNGHDCDHCHFDHSSRKRNRRKLGAEQLEGCPGHTPSTLEEHDTSGEFADEDKRSEDNQSQEVNSQDDYVAGDAAFTSDVHEKDVTDSETQAPSSAGGLSPVESSDSEGAALTQDTPCDTATISYAPNVCGVDVARAARAILNKLTAESFEKLYLQIMGLPMTTHEQLSALVMEIFLTATVQSTFLPLYAELCSRIDESLAGDETTPLGGNAFRRALVTACQKTFESHLQEQGVIAEEALARDEEYEAHVKFKNQMLGNMRFIGELFVRRLLASKILGPILDELLVQSSDASIESAIALLAVVGPHFEQGALLKAAPVRSAFAELQRFSTDKSFSARVRFQMRNLLEARARGWKPRDGH